MHVDRASRHYTATDGSERVYRRDLLRRSYRDEQGRPQKETLANLSALPEAAVVALRKVLSGAVLVEPAETFEIERSLSHGAVAAVHAMAVRLGVKKLLGKDCRERDLAYALVISRVLHPKSKLSTLGWWNDTTLGADLAVADASTATTRNIPGNLHSRQLWRETTRRGGASTADWANSPHSHRENLYLAHARYQIGQRLPRWARDRGPTQSW